MITIQTRPFVAQPTAYPKLDYLLSLAEEQLRRGEHETARQVLAVALKLDAGNERATLALYGITDNCYEARDLLKAMLHAHPTNRPGHILLTQAEARCNELDYIVTGSAYLKLSQVKPAVLVQTQPISRLGQLLLDFDYINLQQLDTALSLQAMLSRLGNHQPLGQLLLEYGYISQEQLDQILQAQKKEFLNQLY